MPITAAGVLILAMRALNTLGGQWELLAGRNKLHGTIQTSEAQIQSLQRHISSYPAMVESVRSELFGVEASFELSCLHLSTFQMAFIAPESKRDQRRALVDTQAQKRQDL